ncbi:MAG: hypothetical protein ACP5JG_07580 [Anaerolineae bacterium]
MDKRDDDSIQVNDEAAPEPKEGTDGVSRSRPVNLDALIWALVFVWAGVVLLLENLGYLDAITFGAFDMRWDLPFRDTVWTLIFLGASALVALDVLVRILVPVYEHSILGYLILMVVLFFVGVGHVELIWPTILISLGLGLIIHRAGR